MTKLFVGNLPYKATEADLQSFFEEAGVHVDSVNILRDRFSGEARGFGFVEINDDALANQAVQAVQYDARNAIRQITFSARQAFLDLLLADAPAVWLGARFAERLPLKAARLGAALLFAGLAVWILLK